VGSHTGMKSWTLIGRHRQAIPCYRPPPRRHRKQ
jgi:hypothetical protein